MRASYILCLVTLLAGCHEQDPAAPTTGPASPGRLASLSSGSCVQVPQGVVGWWTGDGTTRDAAGGHHGSAVGNVSFGPGKVGQAYSLQRDGNVEVPYHVLEDLRDRPGRSGPLHSRSSSGPT